MAIFSFDETKLQAGQALLETLEQAYLTQEREKGDAQAITPERDAALDDMDEWIADYRPDRQKCFWTCPRGG